MYDIMVNALKNEPVSTKCIFSCQMGKGRTTFGMIIAYLVKEVQLSSDILKLVPVGLLSRRISESLIHKKFEQPPARAPAES